MGVLLEQARFYLQHGIVAIPLKPASKFPYFKWHYWTKRTPRDLELQHWFDCDRKNIGLICGGKANLVVIDFDRMDGYEWWAARCREAGGVWHQVLEEGYKVKTSRGVHVYVRTEEPVDSCEIKSRGIGIRSRNHYTVAPPSIHPNGTRYQELCEFILHTVSDLFEFFEVPKVEKTAPVAYDCIYDAERYILRDSSTVEMVKRSTPILDYVSRLTHMQPSGSDNRWWYGRCVSPTHEDRHPSFQVDTVLGRCRCLTPSCILYAERGLDVIDLHAALHRLSLKESIHDLYLNLETASLY